MALDGLLLHQISSELKEYLPCKISKIQNISDVELLWTLRTTKGNRRLLTSFHSTYNRLHLTQASYTTMETPSNFVHAAAQAAGRRIHPQDRTGRT